MNSPAMSSCHQCRRVCARPGLAWWLLCHDPPIVGGANAPMLRLPSRSGNSRLPMVCPSEFTAQVAWSRAKMRANPPHSMPPTNP